MMKLLADPKMKTIVVEHRDRLMRFGFEEAIQNDDEPCLPLRT